MKYLVALGATRLRVRHSDERTAISAVGTPVAVDLPALPLVIGHEPPPAVHLRSAA